MPNEILELLVDETIPMRERIRMAVQLLQFEDKMSRRPVTRKTIVNDLMIAYGDAEAIGDKPAMCAVAQSIVRLTTGKASYSETIRRLVTVNPPVPSQN